MKSKYPLLKIGPSILGSDLANLREECLNLLKAGADYLHLDVMDGHFVPNITFGHPVVKCLRKHIKSAFFDMHMMVAKPGEWVGDMAAAGATQYTFHIEAVPCENDAHELIRRIKETGMLVGVGVKPGTSVDALFPFVDEIDMALIMTVEPGFGGQSFMQDMMPKVELLRERLPLLDIEVDGGVGPSNVGCCTKAGANMIVSGSAITSHPQPEAVINELRKIAGKNFPSTH